jgi:phage gpG-like protein
MTSGVALTFGFDDAAITRHLAQLAILDSNKFNSARREIGEFFKADIQDCFNKQTLYDGSAMPPSKAATKRGDKTLIHRHHLYDSYTFNLVGAGVEMGSELAYARIHHFGGETGSKKGRFKMTARPVMGVAERHERAIGDYLIAALRGAGPGAIA